MIKKLNLHPFPPENWQNQLFQHVLTGLTTPIHSQSHPHPHLPIHLVTSCVSVPPCHIHSHRYNTNAVTQIDDGMLNITVMVITVNFKSSGYSFSRHHWHSSRSHTPFRAPASLDWNRDDETHNSLTSAMRYKLLIGSDDEVGCLFHLIFSFLSFTYIFKTLS